MVICDYCGQTNFINADSLEAMGKQVKLVDYGSRLRIGANGSLNGNSFYVLGRMRFNYGDGYWDEWLLDIPNLPEEYYWLQEDEGEFLLFHEIENEEEEPADFEDLEPGMVMEYGDFDVFITEKRQATVNGGEGEIPFQVIPDEQVDFVDGIGKGFAISIEYLPDDEEVYYGEIIPFDALIVEG